ncbi:MAG: hypothetical protein HeimC3_45230 [Candidatus Heimdallarchaeota archaeon LC_3]|nr:MAG: hypothetical protein HeimC3_45230 [Candidatus Heimdallarchaeota archaeon LC_3]
MITLKWYNPGFYLINLIQNGFIFDFSIRNIFRFFEAFMIPLSVGTFLALIHTPLFVFVFMKIPVKPLKILSPNSIRIWLFLPLTIILSPYSIFLFQSLFWHFRKRQFYKWAILFLIIVTAQQLILIFLWSKEENQTLQRITTKFLKIWSGLFVYIPVITGILWSMVSLTILYLIIFLFIDPSWLIEWFLSGSITHPDLPRSWMYSYISIYDVREKIVIIEIMIFSLGLLIFLGSFIQLVKNLKKENKLY